MRLEKGLGSVSKQSGNRRNPYICRVVEGYKHDVVTGQKYPIQKVIGYTKTKREGKELLENYHRKGKCDATMTFAEVFESFKDFNYEFLSTAIVKNYNTSYSSCEKLENLIFSDVRLENLQDVIDSSEKNYPTLRKMKSFLSQLYKFAIMNDICSIDYAKDINIKKHQGKNPNSNKRNKLLQKDIEIFWEKSTLPYYQMILILIYTGVRISEILELKKSDVNLEGHYFDIIASKTENGIRRVPIADKIYGFVLQWYYKYENTEYLFCTESKEKFKYRNFYDSYFCKLMQDCGMVYTPHWCRHTFVSMMVEAGVEVTIIKKIVGHNGSLSLHQRIYTHLEVQILLDAVNKI